MSLSDPPYNARVIVDLHMHSTASDGSLEPMALLELAAANGVDMLAVTDHDTLAAYRDLESHRFPLQLVTGIELSTQWHGVNLHVVGLNVDPRDEVLARGIERQLKRRDSRARTIGDRLAKLGIDGAYDRARAIAGEAVIGRPHFALALVESGVVPDVKTAFRKYLGAGKPGDVKQQWAPMAEAVGWITTAGGTAVLAHPAKYRMTKTRMRALISEFGAAGGTGIEVVCGSQTADITARFAGLATEFGLLASCGSDFHDPGNAWSSPGRFPPLPAGLPRVWDTW